MLAGRAVIFLLALGFAMGGWAQENSAPAASQAGSQAARTAGESPAPAPLGSIHGIVAGSEGAVYEGVHVTLSETAPNGAALPERTGATGSDGQFTFTGVPAGAFKLTISSEGFATKTVTGALGAGQSFDVHEIVLPMAGASTEVKVSASTVEIAEEQLHLEEQQRVLGVIPNFYVTYNHNAAPLTAGQKYQLAWRTSIDPFTFGLSAAFAGVEQAENTYPGYGQGAQGYAKRFGANYADNAIETVVGGAVLPALFKQDPRYFYKGTGTVRQRVLYALATAVICKGDNGHWQFNYSGILGSLAAGGISNLYYPASDRDGAELTFENAGIGIAGSAVGNLFQEFVIKKLTPKAERNTGTGTP